MIDDGSPTNKDGEPTFACLSANFRQVVRQGSPSFAVFISPLTLELTTNAEL